MQPREKKLAMIVGGLVGVLTLFFVFTKVRDAYKVRADKHVQLSDDLAFQTLQLIKANETKTKLAKLEARSLPGDVEQARSQYQKWLLASLVNAGMSGIEVNNVPGGITRRAYHPMSFNVTAKGNLTQFITWLHAFHRAGHLHQIRRLNATPVEKSKLLELDIGVEAMVMHGAKGVAEPPQMPERLERGDLATYRKIIEGRNLAGMPNQAPTLAAVSRVTGKLGQPVTFTLRGSDKDPLDKLTYRFDGEAPKGATLDTTTGKFTWTPPVDAEPGTVTVKVLAEDDGMPAKSASQTVSIAVERIGLKLAAIGDQKLDVGKAFSATPRFLEHDAKRTKSFELKGDAPEGFSFDAKTGAMKWTPTEDAIGKDFRLTLIATDDATPPNRDEKRFELAVLEPEIPKLELDFAAQRTYLTAILDVDGTPQAWFQIRPTGQEMILALPQGPNPQDVELRAGNFTGRLVEIDFDSDRVILESHGRRLTLYRGKSLADAVAASTEGL
jgi:hypothetical protein